MNEKWMFLSVDEVEKKLNTSAASGLSRKAARGRLQKAGENAFFLFPHSSPIDCVREVITQPSVALLLVLGVLLLFFKQPIQGKILLGLTLMYAFILIALRVWSGRILRIPVRAALPPIRVIREGQMFFLHHTRLVPGDLIELGSGDIVPCDLRIVSSDDLCVLTYLGAVKGEDKFVRTLKSGAEECAPRNQHDITLHGNMLYGGSVIEHGQVKALVVETGRHTYIGALQGGYPLKIGHSVPESALKTKKTATSLQIALLLAVIPLLCLCLLIGKTKEGLPMLFSTLLCLCLANLAGNMETLLRFGMALGVYRGISPHSHGESALIKTDKNADRLLDFDVLCLFGTQAFAEPVTVPGDAGALPVSLKERNEELRRREMQLVLGDHFLETAEDHLRQLREAGIAPVLFLKDSSRQAATGILRAGIAATEKEIAFADQFRSQDRSVVTGWGKYRAYCGFSNDELMELFEHLRKNKKKIAILGNTVNEYSLLKYADVCFACVNDMKEFTESNKSREKNAQTGRGREDVATLRMRRKADVLIPCADRRHGGIAAITHVLQTVSTTQRNLNALTGYLIFTQLIRLILVLPTMLFGIHMVFPIQAVFSGLVVDLLFALLLLARDEKNTLSRVRKHGSGNSWKIAATEALFAGMLTLTAFLFIYHNVPDTASAAASLFVSLLLIQFTEFLCLWSPIAALRVGTNRKNAMLAVCGCLLFLVLAGMFRCLKEFGFAMLSSPYHYLILIAPLSVLLVSAVVKLYQSGRSE